jgi:anti-sigma B factor antagonist
VDLQIDVRTSDGVTILDVVGEVDLYTAPRLEEGLRQAASGTRPLLAVNLTRVAYLDSTALRVLTESHREVQSRQGAIVVIATHATIQKIFHITGLGTVLPVVSTEQEAVAQLRTPPPVHPHG